MPVIKPTCKTCGKQVDLIRGQEIVLGDDTLYLFSCGHMDVLQQDAAIPVEDHNFKSIDETMEAYEYQKDGVKFIEETNGNALIADGMGLGKTIQAALYVKNSPQFTSDGSKVLIVVQSATTYQWAKEWEKWVDNSDLNAFPIIGTKGLIPSCFKVYIISRDTLGRKDFYKKLLKLKISLVIIDEVQAFKDSNSNRTIALTSLLREGKIEHKVMLSGTPIKNRASEYFTALNILSPIHFPNKARFQREWLIPNEKGIYTRLNPWKIDSFHQMTSKWILRREKEDVLKNLPEFRRNEQWIYIDDPEVKESYNAQLRLFDNFMNNSARISSVDILGWLARFRKIVGNAKLPFTKQYIEMFLEENETEKLCIGIHHETVREALYSELKLNGHNVLQLSGKDDAAKKTQLVSQFEKPENRVMIANILAGGVGLNLQFCNNAIIMERQWNSADEEQFEARFHRNGQTRPVTCDYLIAHGTIDHFLTDLVNEKRKIFGETMGGYSLTEDENGLRDLSQRILSSPL
jgi:SNF2 family DNA or RNA helicase